MRLNSTEKKLFEAFKDIKIIDSHEHLAPEQERTKQKVDLPVLFSFPYTTNDLVSSGMPGFEKSLPFLRSLGDTKIPLKKRWKTLSPHLKKIRYGSYARAVYLSVKEFYGFDEINDENYVDISEAMAKANVPGIYHRILREKCNIQTALTQAGRTDYDLDLLVPVMPGTWADVRSKNQVEERTKELGETAETLDDYVGIVKERLKRWKSEGVVGIKIASRPYAEANRGKAVALFDSIMQNPELELPDLNPLQSYILNELFETCADMDLVVAVHTGMGSMWWGDFRQLDPKHMIPIVMKHPRTKFDIYHMGMPWVRETAIIGKNFPNAWLNLCWSHIISPQMAISALDEWIDLVPVNKIIAFGGDYGALQAECIYGHLIMARENIAKVLGRRVKDGQMSMNEAVSLAEDWFYNVPKDLYKV